MNRRLAGLIVAGLTLVMLAACGQSPTATPLPTPTPTATSLLAPTPTVEQQTGAPGTLAQNGDTVSVHYTGTLDDGSVFDTSRDGDPFTLTLGGGGVIAGFNDAVLGLAVGETVTVRLEPAEAYGERDESLIIEVPLDQVPEGVAPGDVLQSATGAVVTIIEVTDEVARFDANHPFAGTALTFEIELVSIE